MRYLGIARTKDGRIVMPDACVAGDEDRTFEVVELGEMILLTTSPLDKARIEQVDRLARDSIADHRDSLEGLAQ